MDSREIVHFDDSRAEYCLEVAADDCGIVIFGASGDLTRRKLIPSLFQLYRRSLLPEHFLSWGVPVQNCRKKLFVTFFGLV